MGTTPMNMTIVHSFDIFKLILQNPLFVFLMVKEQILNIIADKLSPKAHTKEV